MKQKIFLDTGGEIDGQLVVLLLAWLDDLAGVGITRFGESFPHAAAADVQDMLRALKMQATPVAIGPDIAISSKVNRFPLHIRIAISWLVLKQIRPRTDVQEEDAVEMYRRLLSDLLEGEQLTILVTGPINNIAVLLKEYPELAEKIKEVVIMAGALGVDGNLNELSLFKNLHPAPEWNAFVVPEDLAYIFKVLGEKAVLVPLDVTHDKVLTAERASELLAKVENSYVRELLKKRFDSLLGTAEKMGQQVFLWDVVAALVAILPGRFTRMTKRVSIVTDPKQPDYGATREDDHGSLIQVCDHFTPAEFWDAIWFILDTSPSGET